MTTIRPRLEAFTPPSGSPSTVHGDGSWSTSLEKWVATLTLFAIGSRQYVDASYGLTFGVVLAILLAPLWLTSLRRFWGARALLAVGVLAIAAGAGLSQVSKQNHTVRSGLMITAALLVLGILFGVGIILWCRTIMSIPRIGVSFGLGMAYENVFSHNDVFTSNPWKYGWAVTSAVLLLSLLARDVKPGRQFIALLTLAAVSIGFSSRSYFATFLLAALLVLWQMRPRIMSHRASWVWTAGFMAALVIGVYYLGTTLLVGGYLGEAAQEKSVQQIDTSGSLILGGRPELAATLALMGHGIWGFGLGVVANSNDVLVAKSGLSTINYDPNNGYVENYMFGGQPELHSVIGDLWAALGVMGLVLVALIAYLLIRSVADAISARNASAIVLFLTCWTLWNLFFSPLLSSAATLMLVLGLALPARALLIGAPGEESPPDGRPPDVAVPRRATVAG